MQIVIPFVQVNAVNPNLPRADFNSSMLQYFRCIAVSCQSFRQMNSGMRIVVITNKAIADDFKQIFSSLDVQVQITPFTFNPPPSFGDRFRGCFYFFDALQTLDADSLIVDPDVICLENLDAMVAKLGEKIAIFRPNFSAERDINGISPNTAKRIYDEFIGNTTTTNPEHIGGEAIFFPKDSIGPFMAELTKIWEWNISRSNEGHDYLTTEEHILTCLLRNTQCDSLSPFIARIWTAKTYKGIEGEVKDLEKLVLWHLPSEKGKGFQSIFQAAFQNNGSGLTQNFNRSYYLRHMNLNPNCLERVAYSLYRKLKS